MPAVDANEPKVMWAMDFQFDSTVDGRAVKIASMIAEHTQESLLHLVERSITSERLVAELEQVFAVHGAPKVLRLDNGPEMISAALQSFSADRVGISFIPPGTPWNNGYVESFNRRLRVECLDRNHWTNVLEARVVIADFKHEHNHRHRHSALGYRTPPSTLQPAPTPTPGGLGHQLNIDDNNPTLNRVAAVIGNWSRHYAATQHTPPTRP